MAGKGGSLLAQGVCLIFPFHHGDALVTKEGPAL